MSPWKTNLIQVNTMGHDDGEFCFDKDHTDRNKWITVFSLMEVAIFAYLDGHRFYLLQQEKVIIDTICSNKWQR